MAKIKIKGCGNCTKSKGCEIKKQFRNIAQTMPHTYKTKEVFLGMNSNYTNYYEIDFKCPIADRKYKPDDKVIFTLGVQRYTQTVLWDCDISYGDDDPCEFCNKKDNCNESVVTFKNIRYKNYIECEGHIVSLIRGDKWIIKVSESEWERISKQCNHADLNIFESIANSIDCGADYYMVFISKEKFIQKL
jgi:hypothetical protein